LVQPSVQQNALTPARGRAGEGLIVTLRQRSDEPANIPVNKRA
jgi:hypothetical protein